MATVLSSLLYRIIASRRENGWSILQRQHGILYLFMFDGLAGHEKSTPCLEKERFYYECSTQRNVAVKLFFESKTIYLCSPGQR
jgi:hypothetical protein